MRAASGRIWKRLATRAVLVLVGTGSLYLLAPSLIAVFSSWRRLTGLSPAWLAAVAALEAASFVSLWELERISLRTRSWFTVGASQLAGNAFGRIVPGGLAAASALQFQMLTRAGVPPATAATGLPAASALSIATVLALPVLSVPAMVAGAPVSRSLAEATYIGLAVFVLMLLSGILLLSWDRPLELGAGTIQWLLNRIRRRQPPLTDLAARTLRERNALRDALGSQWWRALLAGVGNSGLDYLALLAALTAVGSRARPSLVLLAYVASVLLGLIPFTPGGLGFVEAGLTGMLVLAGVGGGDAVLATLVYRLASFWLPIPAGLIAYGLFHYRYPDRTDHPNTNPA